VACDRPEKCRLLGAGDLFVHLREFIGVGKELGLLGGADRHTLLDQTGIAIAVALRALITAGLTGRQLLRVRIATRSFAIGIRHAASVRDGPFRDGSAAQPVSSPLSMRRCQSAVFAI
jgi:hypothetical protein